METAGVLYKRVGARGVLTRGRPPRSREKGGKATTAAAATCECERGGSAPRPGRAEELEPAARRFVLARLGVGGVRETTGDGGVREARGESDQLHRRVQPPQPLRPPERRRGCRARPRDQR